MTETIDGRIRLVKELGHSESCVFYQAEHTLLHRTVLVCLYDETASRTEDAVASQLSGYHNGKFFSASEWVDGLTVDEFKARFGIGELTETFASELRTSLSQVKTDKQSHRLKQIGFASLAVFVGACSLAAFIQFGKFLLPAEVQIHLASMSGDKLEMADAFAAQAKAQKLKNDSDGAYQSWSKASRLYADCANKAFVNEKYETAADIYLKSVVSCLDQANSPGDVVPVLGQISQCFAAKGKPELVDRCFNRYFSAHERSRNKYRNRVEERVQEQMYARAHVAQIRARTLGGKLDDAQELMTTLAQKNISDSSDVGRAFLIYSEAELAYARGDRERARALKLKCAQMLDRMDHFEIQCASDLVVPCSVALRMNGDFAEATNILRILNVDLGQGRVLYTNDLMLNDPKSAQYNIFHQRVLNDLGFSFLEQGMRSDAMKHFKDSAALLIPGNSESQKAYVTTLSRQAQGHIDLGETSQAVQNIEKYTDFIDRNKLEMNEELWFGNSKLAEISAKQRNYADAVKHLQNAIVIAEKQKLLDDGKRVRNEATRLRECYVQLHKMREAEEVSRKYGV